MTGASRARAATAAEAAEAKGAADLVVLDLHGQTLVTDYFVIGTATSRVHLRALREGIEEAMAAARVPLLGREGDEASQWVLLDYGDVIVHLFTDQTRGYYKLERMWSRAQVVDVRGEGSRPGEGSYRGEGSRPA